MGWKYIQASVIGTSHINSGLPCQDECFAEVFSGIENTDYLICIVSDGAGSAKQGGRGAELTCSTAIKSIESSLFHLKEGDLDELCIEEWVKDIRREIYKEADSKSIAAKEFACTLLGAVIGPKKGLFFQIGDGAIIASSHFSQGVVFWPESGEYANMTYFVTDKNALNHLQVTITTSQINEIALFSDGIQRLALSYLSYTPHTPFFEPMFDVIRRCNENEFEMYSYQLAKFLNNEKVNERTDDDKTLVLATRKK